MKSVVITAIVTILIAVTFVSTASGARHHRASSVNRCDSGFNIVTGQSIRWGTNVVTGYAIVNGTDMGDGNPVRCF